MPIYISGHNIYDSLYRIAKYMIDIESNQLKYNTNNHDSFNFELFANVGTILIYSLHNIKINSLCKRLYQVLQTMSLHPNCNDTDMIRYSKTKTTLFLYYLFEQHKTTSKLPINFHE